MALKLPGVQEGTSSGTPAFRLRGRFLAHLLKDEDSLAIKVNFAVRDVLTGAKPDVYYIPPNQSCWPLMFVRLSAVDPDELRQLLEDAWRAGASRRMLAEYDAGRNS
jgi:hypothetical protein